VRRLSDELLVLGGGAALTAALTYGLVTTPAPAAAALALLALVAGVALFRREIAALRVGAVVAGLALLLPMAALIGPVAALPGFPQLFAFRLLLAIVAVLGVPVVIMSARRVAWDRWKVAAPLALWFAWLAVTLLWAPDKAAGLRYMLVLGTMLAVTAAAASAGVSRRRLRAFCLTMIVAYVFIVGVTVLEYTTGYRVPTSRLATVVTTQTFAVTSVFRNQNDLATYLALCWPFLLGAAFVTRRFGWLALSLVLTLFGALAFVRTGSRSSLLAAGISTIAVIVLFASPGEWMQTRRARVLGAILAVALIAGAGFLLFNDSESDMLRQFRLTQLASDVSTQQGSGEYRLTLTDRGLMIAGESGLLGAGPGQADVLVASGTDATDIVNLHDWWLELYANGGLPGLALQLAFLAVMALSLLGRARHARDPFVRYLAGGVVAALAGFVVGALGPSSSLRFAPMWILFGLGIAILALPRDEAGLEREADEAGPTASPSRPPAPGTPR